MRSRLNSKRSYHTNNRKINNTHIWSSRKTNETNRLKVKTWGGFDLTIFKVNKSTKRNWSFYERFNPKSIATFNSNLLTRLRANFESTDSSLLDLQHTSSHAYDFEIPLKGFRSPLVDLATTKFHQHLIVDLVPVDACRVKRHKTSQISQE